MAGNISFLKAAGTQAWLAQFAPEDQRDATELLRAMLLVSRDSFAERLRALIIKRISEEPLPVGIYVEREVQRRNGVPHRLFKESKGKIRRAYGGGPALVQPTKHYDPSVGSEGLVAHLVSELAHEFRGKIYLQPGPDLIRKHHIRRFILVTDFIGSGQRAWTYLQAAWRVRSVRSWWSARASKGLSFEVAAYAASRRGRAQVEGHPCKPVVHVVTASPTIDTVFGDDARRRIDALCRKYMPVKNDPSPARGYGNVGALIAFSHGVPNNAPLILYRQTPTWAALFPRRITSSTRQEFQDDSQNADAVRSRLLSMRQTRLAAGQWIESSNPQAKILLMVMAGLGPRPRHSEAVSARTGLTIIEIEQSLKRALRLGWIDGRNRLTDEGQRQLAHARRRKAPTPALPLEPEEFYYPTSLRAPAGV